MTTVSLAMIVFNEQKHMRALLTNVYDMFDEIAIVDGGSTDKTVGAIQGFAAQMGDRKIKIYTKSQRGRRYSNSWKQNQHRNYALSKCTGDWIFTIDADERLDSNVRERLEWYINNTDKHAFAMPTHHYWDTDKQIRIDGRWYPDYHYRAWKRKAAIYSPHKRHCYPVIKGYPDVRKVTEEESRAPYTDIIIHHYHHVPIQKHGKIYRANFKEVKTRKELEKGLRLRTL